MNIHLGIVAYQSYGDSVNWKNFQGNPMPTWDDLPIHIRQAWINAAQAVYDLRDNADK